jgi:hypothetical protein
MCAIRVSFMFCISDRGKMFIKIASIPLPFYTISFGSRKYSRSLKRDGPVKSVYFRPAGSATKIPCEYMYVNEAVQALHKQFIHFVLANAIRLSLQF